MAALATLTDNFNDNSTNATLWSSFGTPLEQNRRLELSTTAGTTNYAGYTSNNLYDLTGSYGYCQLIDAGNQSLTSLQVVPLILTLDSDNSMSWYVNGGTIHAQTQIATVYSDVKGDLAYDSTQHKFFRIRESGGVTYWDYSADGVYWKNYCFRSNPFAVTSLLATVEVGTYNSEASSTTAIFDNFNTMDSGANASFITA